MTASELKYLIAVNELNDSGNGTKMSAVAKKLNVSKVSVYRAVERLNQSGYIGQSGKRIILTETGSAAVASFMPVVDFIGDKLVRHCNTPKEVAFDEAIVVACALGDNSRNAVLSYVKNNGVN